VCVCVYFVSSTRIVLPAVYIERPAVANTSLPCTGTIRIDIINSFISGPTLLARAVYRAGGLADTVRAYFPRPISLRDTHTPPPSQVVSGTRNEWFRLRRWEPEHVCVCVCVQQSKTHIIIIIRYVNYTTTTTTTRRVSELDTWWNATWCDIFLLPPNLRTVHYDIHQSRTAAR